MGAMLEKPKTEKETSSGSGNGISYAMSSMQGWRIEQEDAHIVQEKIPQLPDWSFYAVLDGHASDKVSKRASKELLDCLQCRKDWNQASSDEIKKRVNKGFLAMDTRLQQIPDLNEGEGRGGSTCTSVLISPNNYYFANLGDSRTILIRDGNVHFATLDHKPSLLEEMQRIEDAGGSVVIDRVDGELAVSRAFGDFEYKQAEGKSQCEQKVSPEPDVTCVARATSDQAVILACDGIWDVMTNDEVAEFILYNLKLTKDLVSICNLLIDTCLHKNSRDNMSVILLTLRSAPSPSNETQLHNTKFETQIRNKATVLKSSDSTQSATCESLFSKLLQVEFDDPPPGGVYTKFEMICKLDDVSST